MRVDLEAPPVAIAALKALAEPVRWRIVELLAAEELCVCHIVESLDIPQPLVSHHLRVLREAGLVDSSRFRYWTYYRLLPEGLAPLAGSLTGLATATPPVGERRRPCC